MSNFYIDFVNGNDANDGLGPYKAAFTSGGTYEIQVGDTVTDDTTAATAKVVLITVSSGSWAGGDAAGTLYVGTPSGAFTASGTISVGANSNVATLTGDFAVSSWLTVNSGATAARTAPGDEIRMKKTTGPEALGINATFTNGSPTVTLASANTIDIYDCETAFTASANITASRVGASYTWQGSYCCNFQVGSSFTTGKMAYYDLGAGNELNLSAYSKISFAIGSSNDQAASRFRLCLCSDATGNTPVDEFTIPQLLPVGSYPSGMHTFQLTRDGGGALGSSIRSIALYADVDPGTPTLYLDNIIACADFHHNVAIGDSSTGDFYAIRGIKGTTVTLTGCYWGTGGNVAAYVIKDWITCQTTDDSGAASIWATFQESGSAGTPYKYRGGWNFSSNEQDGYTHFMSSNGYCTFFYTSTSRSYFECENLHFLRGMIGVSFAYSTYNKLKNIKGTGLGKQLIYCDNNSGIYKIEGVLECINTWNASDERIILQTMSDGALTITGDIKVYGAYTDEGSGLVFRGGLDGSMCASVYMTGTCTLMTETSNAILLTLNGMAGAFFKKLVINKGIILSIPTMAGRVEIDEIAAASNTITLRNNSARGSIGLLRIGSVTIASGSRTADEFMNTGSYDARAGMFLGRICIDRYLETGKWIAFTGYGMAGDHVTMGQAAEWAYGGSGTSLVLDPLLQAVGGSSDYPMIYDFYIPAVTGKNYKLSMQVKKTSSGANCTLNTDIFGCGITPIIDESVTLTDSWAEHLSSQFTTTYTGMIHVMLKAVDGSTTGDIGIDEIKLTEIV